MLPPPLAPRLPLEEPSCPPREANPLPFPPILPPKPAPGPIPLSAASAKVPAAVLPSAEPMLDPGKEALAYFV